MAERMRRNTREVQAAARAMRRAPTQAEEVLWGALRDRQMGVKFRRQHPVGQFILDFWCADMRLAVELDGEIHDEQAERDAERTRILEAHHYRIVRFRNEEVLNDLDGVLMRIRAALSPFHALEDQADPPTTTDT